MALAFCSRWCSCILIFPRRTTPGSTGANGDPELSQPSDAWGLCPQTPGIYRFFQPEWALFSEGNWEGDNGCRPPAFPAAEPVARVASQHCHIPYDSGRLSMKYTASQFNQHAASVGILPCLTSGDKSSRPGGLRYAGVKPNPGRFGRISLPFSTRTP